MRAQGMILLIGICAASSAHAGKDDKAVAELKAMSEKMMNSYATGDMAAFQAAISDGMWGAWDLDMMGRPVAMATAKDAVKLMEEATQAMKAMGGSMKMSLTKNDCHVSGEMGVCLVEGTATMTAPNMPPMPMEWRNTEVYQKAKGGWKIVHHHGSVAKAPDMPPKFMSMNAKTAQTQPVPGMPGVTMAPVWMNPITQSMVGLMKVGKDGMKQTRHKHPAAYAFYVIEGSVITTDGNGKDTEFGPGSVVYRPAGLSHQTSIKPNSTVFMVTDGPLMAVDDAGKPVAPTPLAAK